jgi:NAD(P)-dependent dehydrogenase (short-subunit alcohol dehydrogenase family)
MKVVLVGAHGTIGSKVNQALKEAGHQVVPVGRKTGDFWADISNPESVRELYRKIGEFDAVANASGDVAFASLEQLTPEQWTHSLNSKLMGQIHLVQEALPFIREGGSFTLVSGILSAEPIRAGVAATVVNRAIEGFAMAAACELPKSLRINVISPAMLEEAKDAYGAFFPGFKPVLGADVAQAYVKAICGVQTGKTFRVGF